MRGALFLLAADVGGPNCEIVLSQDAAGPNVESCSTGAFCLGLATPPVEQIEAIFGRREVRDRRHLGPDALPVDLRPVEPEAEVAEGTPQLEAKWQTRP